MDRNLSAFSGNSNFTLLRKFQAGTWFIAQHIFLKSVLFPSSLRPYFFKIFGAKIGRKVLIRRGVKVHFPWNLEIGDNCWIGEEVWFINHEKISLGSNVCISQRSIICSGGHDFKSKSLAFAHEPVKIMDGAWVCADAKVLPGVTVGECSVVSAGEIARKSIPDFSMLISGEICKIEPPK